MGMMSSLQNVASIYDKKILSKALELGTLTNEEMSKI